MWVVIGALGWELLHFWNVVLLLFVLLWCCVGVRVGCAAAALKRVECGIGVGEKCQ